MLYIDAVEVGVIGGEVFLSKNCRIGPGHLFGLVDIISWEADRPMSFLKRNDCWEIGTGGKELLEVCFLFSEPPTVPLPNFKLGASRVIGHC